jgi:hypothetical protein
VGRDLFELGDVRVDPSRRAREDRNQGHEEQDQKALEHPGDQHCRTANRCGDRAVVLIEPDHAGDRAPVPGDRDVRSQ